jgi:hypothetical protein
MSDIKSKADRLSETIRILKKLKEVGISSESYPYGQIQDLMTAWVNDGQKVSEEIDFVSHIGELVLPDKYNQTATLHLKSKNK